MAHKGMLSHVKLRKCIGIERMPWKFVAFVLDIVRSVGISKVVSRDPSIVRMQLKLGLSQFDTAVSISGCQGSLTSSTYALDSIGQKSGKFVNGEPPRYKCWRLGNIVSSRHSNVSCGSNLDTRRSASHHSRVSGVIDNFSISVWQARSRERGRPGILLGFLASMVRAVTFDRRLGYLNRKARRRWTFSERRIGVVKSTSRAIGVRRLDTRAMLSRSSWESDGLDGTRRFEVIWRRSSSGRCNNVAPGQPTCGGGGDILKVEVDLFG